MATGRRVVVAGARVAGAACARVLLARGVEVTVVDRAESANTVALAAAGARVVIADEPPANLFDGVSDLIVSPGFAPDHPLVRAARRRAQPEPVFGGGEHAPGSSVRAQPEPGFGGGEHAPRSPGLDIYCEPELAWRLRGPHAPPWLAITGTNGKTTAVTMLAAMLRAAGLRTAALGNIGEPLVFAAGDPAYDVLAVELSSFQLYWSSTLAPQAGALLNLAADHLEWHGTFEAYARAKTAIWRAASSSRPASFPRPASGGGSGRAPDRALAGGALAGGPSMAGHAAHAGPVLAGGTPAAGRSAVAGGALAGGGGLAVGNLDDGRVAALLSGVAAAPAQPPVGFTLGEPKPGQFGVVDGVLVDHAFAAEPVELCPADSVRPAGAHNVANALAAAVLARWYGVPATAVRDGLAGYVPEPHRNAHVATVRGVDYVDDSKATNPHAALASLTAYPRIVWVAGGQLKGVDVGDLVAAVAGRLAGAVLLGVDRAKVAQALARHAPQVPVVDVASTDDGAMRQVVRAAAGLARPGDTVLLAPAAASLDMFASYGRRGDAFAAAVRSLEAPGVS